MIELKKTPVELLADLSGRRSELWVKRDDLTNALYGGNKARKLVGVLGEARARGARRLVTLGAMGSHHVLATAVFGRREGFEVEAVMVPQPLNDHVERNYRAALAQGLAPRPVRFRAEVPFALAMALASRGTFFVTAGGSSAAGAWGYVEAARELAAQVRANEMPEPDIVVVALGSGGTVAGLAVGLAAAGLKTRVHAVLVAEPEPIILSMTSGLIRALALRADVSPEDAFRRLSIDRTHRGAGYGEPAPWGAIADVRASQGGLALDGTYTAKTFAAALDLVEDFAARTILYWHTLSSAPMEPLLHPAT